MNYKVKYLKYKNKYLQLKGGMHVDPIINDDVRQNYVDKIILEKPSFSEGV
jgi:hypothetical protein